VSDFSLEDLLKASSVSGSEFNINDESELSEIYIEKG